MSLAKSRWLWGTTLFLLVYSSDAIAEPEPAGIAQVEEKIADYERQLQQIADFQKWRFTAKLGFSSPQYVLNTQDLVTNAVIAPPGFYLEAGMTRLARGGFMATYSHQGENDIYGRVSRFGIKMAGISWSGWADPFEWAPPLHCSFLLYVGGRFSDYKDWGLGGGAVEGIGLQMQLNNHLSLELSVEASIDGIIGTKYGYFTFNPAFVLVGAL